MAILKDLIVHGSSRFLNKIYANEIQAEEGIFSKLIAKNADITDLTVYGLLDSQGQLHTKTWTNSNIATIDGSFYITPTLNSDSGTFSFRNSTSTNARFIGDFSVMNSNSMYLGGKSPTTSSWTADSKVLITGQVKVNNEWIPLGNVVADISSVNSTTLDIKNIRTTINGNTAPSTTSMIYFVKPNYTLSYRNLKISLCEIYRNNASNPLGIYITSSGLNGKTFLDIYGGVEATSTAGNSGGLAKPNVRIGNLSGIPSFTTSGGDTVSPSGWGIFTTNGYFEGAIISDVGNIGGWNLTADSIWKNNKNFGNASGMYFGASGISLGSTFKVTNAGILTATNGTIGGWTIGTNGIYNGITGVTTSGSTVGTFIGTGGISNYQNSSTYVNIQNGVITAKGASFLTATIGEATNKMTIGNGTSNQQSAIKYGMNGLDDTTNDGFYIGTDGIALGKGAFKVTKEGALTASNVDLTGKITATDGSIGGATITGGTLTVPAAQVSGELTAATISGAKITSGTIEIGKLNTAAQNTISNAAKTASDYITVIDANGIWVTPSNLKPTNTSTGVGATGTRINGDGMEIFKDGVSVASYGNQIKMFSKTSELIMSPFSFRNIHSKQTIFQIEHYLEDSSLNSQDSFIAEEMRTMIPFEQAQTNYISQYQYILETTININMIFYNEDQEEMASTDVTASRSSRPSHTTAQQILWQKAMGVTRKQSAGSISFLLDINTSGKIVFKFVSASIQEETSTSHVTPSYVTYSISYATDGLTYSPYLSFGSRKDALLAGKYSTVLGNNNSATGMYSFSSGTNTTASGHYSHAEGDNSEAQGISSHAEGSFTRATGDYAHAEGLTTQAINEASHAEGQDTYASGFFSHASNLGTIAYRRSQTAIGEYNKRDDQGGYPNERGAYAFIIGNGTESYETSNALTVDWGGNIEMALNTTTASGTDYNLYTAINDLGWTYEVVIE